MSVSIKHLSELDWTFKTIRAKDGIHGIHSYPAMMAPPVAGKLILEFTVPNDKILDPFCGSGTVMTEAAVLGRQSFGYDINPLALLIAEVKSTPIPTKELWEGFEKIRNLFRCIENFELPIFQNVDYWFKPNIRNELARLKIAISRIDEERVKKFYLVIFSRVIRETSNTRRNEFKLYRIAPDKLKIHNPDVFHSFEKISKECIQRMLDFNELTKGTLVKPTISFYDSRKSLPLKDESIELMLTSPPYGDSRTTVAYGQFSRLSLQWMDLWKDNIDKESLGGKVRYLEQATPVLTSTLDSIREIDKNRALEAESYYADLYKCLRNISIVIRKGGYAIFVIANRKVRGISIPNDRIIVELMPDFEHITTLKREIPNKRMPSRNSPSNIPGRTDNTMLQEYIVILRKRKKILVSYNNENLVSPSFYK
jgi:hypothetical protein